MNRTQKHVINTVLLGFVVCSLAYTVLIDNPSSESPASERHPLGATLPIVEGVEPDWAVYFFYNDVYCETCEKLEGYALEAVQEGFAGLLDSGELQWRSLNMTTPENKHYPVDFDFY